MLRAYQALTSFKESELLQYGGEEGAVLRSASQFTLGTLYVNLTMLPPSVSKFTGSGPGLQRGLDLLRECVAEDGLMKPLAADQLLARALYLKHVRASPPPHRRQVAAPVPTEQPPGNSHSTATSTATSTAALPPHVATPSRRA